LVLKQYEVFVADRIASNKVSISDTLKRNNLVLFHNPPPKKISNALFKTAALKKDCQFFPRLYIGCQSREADLEQFFAHENQPIPPSLSSTGKIELAQSLTFYLALSS